MEPAYLGAASRSVWGKSRRKDDAWLPLWCHLRDSAGVAGRLWDFWLPASVKSLISAELPNGDADGRALVRWLAGVHDIGKVTPAFAMQVKSLADGMREVGLSMRYDHPDRRRVPHSTAGQVVLEDWLVERYGWSVRRRARQFSGILGGHHGVPPSHKELQDVVERPALTGLATRSPLWRQTQHELLEWVTKGTGAEDRIADWGSVSLPRSVQVLLTGIVIVADWIASNDEIFPYDTAQLDGPDRLDRAWTELDLPTPWRAAPGLSETHRVDELFRRRFVLPGGARPRPLQERVLELADRMRSPGLLIVEAPMGEGKTEAALAAAEVFAARWGAGGCLLALPTRATSDAMFPRVTSWLSRVPDRVQDRGAYSVMLAHGKARANADFASFFRRGRSRSVADDLPVTDGQATVGRESYEMAAHSWLAGRKKPLLSSFVVCTIDQLLFATLKSRHVCLRHLALAGKVVIIDEAHAYDVYMGQFLDRALEWLGAYRVPTIVLSATLPSLRRREMVEAYDRGRATCKRQTGKAIPSYDSLDGDIGYPIIVASREPGAGPEVGLVPASTRSTDIELSPLDDDPARLADTLIEALAEGGCALVIRNTVRRVQQAAEQLRKPLQDKGIDLFVTHSRFVAPDRSANDQFLRDRLGPPEHLRQRGISRPERLVVVASQVAEQSLDIDADIMVTDLAPVDIMLQRLGRLHRHRRGIGEADRPVALRSPRCFVTGVDWLAEPPEPARGSIAVYGRHLLLRSLAVVRGFLAGDVRLNLPRDIAPLVQTAYGSDPVGPEAWQPAMTRAEIEHRDQREAKKQEAGTFLLGSPDPGEGTLVGWLSANVGNADDTPEGRAQVRDTPGESIEVIVVVRRSDDSVSLLPWLPEYGGVEVLVDTEPPAPVARALAACTLPLPQQLCTLDTVDELEQDGFMPGWQTSFLLEGQLVLVLDGDLRARLAGRDLVYSRMIGLKV